MLLEEKQLSWLINTDFSELALCKYHQTDDRRCPWTIRTQIIPTLLRRFVPSQWVMYELACSSFSKLVLVKNRLSKNQFDVHKSEPIGGKKFVMNG